MEPLLTFASSRVRGILYTPSIPNKKRLFEPPPSFWDNLSKHGQSVSTLREFDRRTTPLVHIVSSKPIFPASRLFANLSNAFCRRGGPSLAAILGVGIGMIDRPINKCIFWRPIISRTTSNTSHQHKPFGRIRSHWSWDFLHNCVHCRVGAAYYLIISIYPPRYHLTQKNWQIWAIFRQSL